MVRRLGFGGKQRAAEKGVPGERLRGGLWRFGRIEKGGWAADAWVAAGNRLVRRMQLTLGGMRKREMGEPTSELLQGLTAGHEQR